MHLLSIVLVLSALLGIHGDSYPQLGSSTDLTTDLGNRRGDATVPSFPSTPLVIPAVTASASSPLSSSTLSISPSSTTMAVAGVVPAVSSSSTHNTTTTSLGSNLVVPTPVGSSNATSSATQSIPLSPSRAATPEPDLAQVVVVLQFAFVLETLEFEFYKAGLAKFKLEDFVQVGYSVGQATIMFEQLQEVVINEHSHVSVIQETLLALGAQPVTGCNVSLDAALVDPRTLISTARTLEVVGIAAYAGAAHLVSDLQILTAIASILPVESRHSALINLVSGASVAPQSFEIALSTGQVLAMLGGFLEVGCVSSELGLAANEPLSVIEARFGSTLFSVGSRLVLSLEVEVDLASLFCQLIVGGSPAGLVLAANACQIPPGIDGPVAVYLTNSSTPLASNILVQAAGEIVAGPSIILVDSRKHVVGSNFHPGPRELLAAAGGSLYSVDLGGYSIAKSKGGQSWARATLVKRGSREAHKSNATGETGKGSMLKRRCDSSMERRRSASAPDSLRSDQGVHRQFGQGWDLE